MSAVPTPSQPTLTDFQFFTQNVAGINAAYLPLTSPQYQHAFDQALNIVNLDLAQIRYQRTSWSPYSDAVMNLGVHLLIEYAIDVSYPIAAASWYAGLVTITTAVPNAIPVGSRVAINDLSPYAYGNAPIDPGSQVGAFVVSSVIDSLNFQYPLSPNPGVASITVGTSGGIGGFVIGVSPIGGSAAPSSATVSQQYFTIARARLKINDFAPGVITSTSDLTTSAGLLNPKFMQMLTMENLQLLKTSFGRAYLGIAQSYGPTIWGLS